MVYIHNINPVMISIGYIDLYWYGAMYAISFLLIDYMMKRDIKLERTSFNNYLTDKILLFSIILLLIGGRLGYIIFYDFNYYLLNPMKVGFIWEGGMSFHGGLIGVILGISYISKKEKISFFKLSDFIIPYVPIGLGLGRIGNFINGELYGLPTNANWGIVFPNIDSLPRHPSMLYEFFFEGLVLFFILRYFASRNNPTGVVSALFLIFYSIFRFLIEFARVPDIQIGYLYNDWFTMGQFLSLPMLIFGIMLLYISSRGKKIL